MRSTVSQFPPVRELIGLRDLGRVHLNYGIPALGQEIVRRQEGRFARGGALVVRTNRTGRSFSDRFIVRDRHNEGEIWWGMVNRPFGADDFERLWQRATRYLQGREVFVQEVWAGADPDCSMPVCVITEYAWHSMFARNMFLSRAGRTPDPARGFLDDTWAREDPSKDKRISSLAGCTVLHVPDFKADPEIDGTDSEVFIVLHPSQRRVLIGGTSYAGEIKKAVFTLLNYYLPPLGVLPMHCSANQGEEGDTAIFFGLSGTGKTTLSADGSRTLIGDDEHGWGEQSVFNFEGGCYAKVIGLSADREPEIHIATRKFGTILENVVLDPLSGEVDFGDASYTENTRASYPLEFIGRSSPTGVGQPPANILMLTADAFGVLPPISQLTPEQAVYHFLTGYTARLSGTEVGVSEPRAVFSTCFGAPFMPRRPMDYAGMLRERIVRHRTNCWLVNTGWIGGQYGVGRRVEISHTRSLIKAALAGNLTACRPDPIFGLSIPEFCPEVPADILRPRESWQDTGDYDRSAREVAKCFEDNFAQFAGQVDDTVQAAGIYAA